MKKINKCFTAMITMMIIISMMCTTVYSTAKEDDTNVEKQNYIWNENYDWNWASTVRSYLVALDDGYMKFAPSADDTQYNAEYYSADYELKTMESISGELPIFGGFYAGTDGYYIVSGQENLEESDSVEVMRVTKYDKSWTRISSDSVYGANTLVPFEAGSLRIAEDGDYLIIKTCHKMYKSQRDGLNHQANMCFQYSKSQSKITDKAVYKEYGYVSHSFNQFVQIEDHKIIAIDHGDAYPRTVLLNIYVNSIQNGTFIPDYFESPIKKVNIIDIPGDIRDNFTGTTVGGFEYSPSSYLVVGSVIDFNEFNSFNEVRNIFVSAVSKDNLKVNTYNLTDYSTTGDITVSTPQFVKITDDRFLIMWSTRKGYRHQKFTGDIYYALLNGNGELISEIKQSKGNISDCHPITIGNTALWYTQTNGIVTFYSIDTENMTLESKKSLSLGDVNSDGSVDIADALIISRYDVELAKLDKNQLTVADVNKDGSVNIADALIISRYDVGLIDKI